jgi:hypothetical protein
MAGVLLVEIWFDDHLLIPLGLNAGHVRLHASTFMPITRAPP